jgi:hypothetical protein
MKCSIGVPHDPFCGWWTRKVATPTLSGLQTAYCKRQTSFRALCLCAAAAAFLPTIGSADTVVVLHVDVKNGPASPTLRIPVAGDYTFDTAPHRIRAVLPDDTSLVFDFDKQTVSGIDSKLKTFYQMKFSDFLGLGEKLPPMFSSRFGVSTRATLESLVGQDDIQILGHDAAPYNVYLGAHLDKFITPADTHGKDRPRRGGGGGNGLPGGGLVSSDRQSMVQFSGGQEGSAKSTIPPSSTGVEIAGAMWLSNFQPGDADRAELALAESCCLLREAPGLKGLIDRMKKGSFTWLGGDLSFAVLDSDGEQPTVVPTISFQAKSFDAGHFLPSDFTIPGDYKKVSPPELTLGSAL